MVWICDGCFPDEEIEDEKDHDEHGEHAVQELAKARGCRNSGLNSRDRLCHASVSLCHGNHRLCRDNEENAQGKNNNEGKNYDVGKPPLTERPIAFGEKHREKFSKKNMRG